MHHNSRTARIAAGQRPANSRHGAQPRAIGVPENIPAATGAAAAGCYFSYSCRCANAVYLCRDSLRPRRLRWATTKSSVVLTGAFFCPIPNKKPALVRVRPKQQRRGGCCCYKGRRGYYFSVPSVGRVPLASRCARNSCFVSGCRVWPAAISSGVRPFVTSVVPIFFSQNTAYSKQA